MKLIVIIPSFKTGGLERVATLLANYLIGKKQFRIYIITFVKGESAYHLEESIKIIQPRNKFERNRILRIVYLFFWMRKQFILIKPKTVISFGETYNSFVILSSFFLKQKVVVSNRASPLASLKGFRGLLNPILYPYADQVIIQTYKARKILQRRYRISNMIVIPNPINQKEGLEFEKREFEILNVGRIGGDKNQEWLLNYFDNINKEEWKLSFVGDGPESVKIQNLVKSMKLDDRVRLYGIQKNVDLFYSRASIFAFTSTSEGFPNVLGEAMAHGMAVISFDCIAGPSDLIDNGINGFLVPVGNHTLFQQRLLELMENEALRKKFGESAKNKMKNFESKKILECYENVLLKD